MKIAATSDMHGNLDNLDFSNADIVVFAGDIAPLKGFTSWHLLEQVKWMNTKFAHLCNAFNTVEFVFVPGNHDKFAISMVKDNVVLQPNAHMLIDEGIELNGLKFYGTPWVPVISHCWAFEAEHEKLASMFSKIPNGLDVLITHTPPRIENEKLDVSTQYYETEPFGSVELAKEILCKKPKLAFCGHIHSGAHVPVKFGNTTIVNVSRVNEDYDIAYEPYACEL